MAPGITNRLLAAASAETRDALLAAAEHVTLEPKHPMIQPERPIENVYFIETGVASMILGDTTRADQLIEVSTTGPEGFVGVPLLLHAPVSTANVFVQIPVVAYRVPASSFKAAVAADPAFHNLLLRFAHAMLMQIAQVATCNRIHNINERAARWLLMSRDRVERDTFPLTQEFLAQMLGVRRQAVNATAGELQEAGLINYSRGLITVVDRAGLERAACPCYGIIRDLFDRVFAVDGTPSAAAAGSEADATAISI
jgi:CRP-like cAMP-binding protein